jgi:hypothetical protein
MVASCPVDEHAVGISIGEEFQKMRRLFYDDARGTAPSATCPEW